MLPVASPMPAAPQSNQKQIFRIPNPLTTETHFQKQMERPLGIFLILWPLILILMAKASLKRLQKVENITYNVLTMYLFQAMIFSLCI
jgi:hypothetical protein